MKIQNYKRIMLVGSPGSGKSFLAKALANTLGYDLIHLDIEYWQPNWLKMPKAEWEEKHHLLISGQQWIIDGNYGSTMEARLQAADLVIYLDMSRYMCLWRVLKRHGNKRTDLPDYLDEAFNREFIEFLRYIWKFHKTNGQKIADLQRKYPGKSFLIMRTRRDVQLFLDSINALSI